MDETGGLRDIDAVERAQFLRVLSWVGPAGLVIVGGVEIFLYSQGVLPLWILVVLLVIDGPLILGVVILVHRGTGSLAADLVNTAYAGGSLLPPPPSYARQEVMIARGQYIDAADYFRDHIRVHPEDLEARLRLATLLETHLEGFDEAEQLYLEVRRSHPDARREMAAYNGLIDLYTKRGRMDRLKVELARFADRYQGTVQAEEARRKLKDLKADV